MENDRRKNLNGNQAKRLGKTNPKNNKKRLENGLKNVNSKQTESKASVPRPDSRTSVSDKNTGAELPEAYENMVIYYVDDVGKSMEAKGDAKASTMSSKQNNGEVLCDSSSDLEKESGQEKEISDSEIPHKYSEPSTHGQTTSVSTKLSFDGNSACVDVPLKPSSESSDGIDDKPVEEVKEVDVLDQTSNRTQSVGSDDERIDAEENGEHKDESALEHKIEEMETRIEKLEEELREVAALEISLYSVIPEHGSSAHKVHTPARRLSRLYIHACKHWTLDKRATIAKNTVSGLILIARSCSNDVPRLTFWLSNIIVLRGIISQAFGSSCNSNPFTRFAESNGFSKSSEGKFESANLKWKGGAAKQRNGFMPVVDDWQETGTLIGALEKVESWIFSRIVESVWWQALTLYMQTPADDSSTNKSNSKLLGPALGDQQQGSFAIDLWRSAFQDAFHRLCPVRAGGHDCGCLPVLARMVLKQCVARLDVAMFNAILRESAHEIPTDPISDPIIDSKVLPIPAGDLSFGSGAQLKNSVGNWSRWLNDALGMDGDDAAEEEGQEGEDEYKQGGEREDQSFRLLNELSDLLMLPKDMLMDRSIRKEVCPSVTLTLVKRILCNFTPDEFCPDPVPGAVLEALNAESIVERRLSGETARSFPYAAAPVLYSPPSSADMAEKVAEAGECSPLTRNVSMVQRKGYTSDEELEDLDSPLTTFISKPDLPPVVPNGNGNGKHMENPVRAPTNARYELLREVWSV